MLMPFTGRSSVLVTSYNNGIHCSYQVEVLLRHVVGALLSGEVSGNALSDDVASGAGASAGDRAKLAACLAYLRDRVRNDSLIMLCDEMEELTWRGAEGSVSTDADVLIGMKMMMTSSLTACCCISRSVSPATCPSLRQCSCAPTSTGPSTPSAHK